MAGLAGDFLLFVGLTAALGLQPGAVLGIAHRIVVPAPDRVLDSKPRPRVARGMSWL